MSWEDKAYDMLANRPLGHTDECLTGNEVLQVAKGSLLKEKHVLNCPFCKELIKRFNQTAKEMNMNLDF